jgi:uncharacterized membrane protein
MLFCKNCGTQIQEDVKFCPSCGKETESPPARQTQPVQLRQQYRQQAPANDAEANKTMAILAYILFFIPLLTGAHKTSPFVKYHANQGTVLALLAIAYSIVSGIIRAVVRVPVSVYGYSTGIYYTPGWLNTILWIVSLGILALAIMGIVNAVGGKQKPLPVIGKFTIIK